MAVKAIAFDVLETVFSLEPLRRKLVEAGLPDHFLETWFAGTLRDAFALDTTGVFRPFPEIATATLTAAIEGQTGASDAREKAQRVIEGFSELEAQEDVAPALQAARNAGVRAVALTNGSAKVTAGLFDRAGLGEMVDEIVSVDEVQRWKPAREVYLHAAKRAGCARQEVGFVAIHPWDIHGANRAGLVTGYVQRGSMRFPDVLDPPTLRGASLTEVVEELLTL